MTLRQLETHSPAHGYYDVRDQLKRHIYERSERACDAGDAARDAIRTKPQLARRQKAIRRFFLDCIGGLPPSNTPLDARTIGTVRGKGFVVERVIFESRPKHFVPANLYLPARHAGKTGAVIYVCGHSVVAKHHEGYQEVSQSLVQAGLVVLALDPLGQGERLGYYEPRLRRATIGGGTSEHEHAGNQCLPLGDSITRYFVHDAMRGVDYLMTRPEVDATRIGFSGESGGGLHTAMMMMADPRIVAAAPALFLTSRREYMRAGGAQDAEQIWPGFTAAGFDHEDALLAFAPKPVRVLAAAYDFFPIEGTRRTVERCRRFWRLFGRASDLDLFEAKAPHSYPPEMRRAMLEFFAKHLLGKRVAWPLTVSTFAPSKLWCTRSGQVRGEIPGARFVYDANLERLSGFQTRKPPARRHALAWLRKRVFAHRQPCPLNTRRLTEEEVGDLTAESLLWWSQQGILNHGLVFRTRKSKGRTLPVTLAIWDGGSTALRPHWHWIRSQCRRGRAVFVLNVTGVGSITPNPVNAHPMNRFFGTIHKFATDLIWLDDDLAGLRTFDAIRALDLIASWPGLRGNSVRVYAHGKQGLYGQFAAALDRRIADIEVHGGIRSFAKLIRTRHYDSHDIKSVILRGALRHCDLKDLGK